MKNIAPATIADRDELLQLVALQDNFTPEEKEVALEVIEDGLSGKDDYRILVYREEVNGELAGFICYGPIPMTALSFDLYWIATSPAHRRHGIASQLLATMESSLGNSPGTAVYVDTSSTESYSRARSFYEKHGYQLAARFKNFYKSGDDKMIYRKEL